MTTLQNIERDEKTDMGANISFIHSTTNLTEQIGWR